MKSLVKILLVLASIGVIVVVGCAVFIIGVSSDLEHLADLDVAAIDPADIPDGVYVGEYEQFPVMVKVQAIVSDGKITDIELLEHSTGQGEAAEAIVEDVINEQKLDVDLVSGATYSSKVILKAIEDALHGAT